MRLTHFAISTAGSPEVVAEDHQRLRRRHARTILWEGAPHVRSIGEVFPLREAAVAVQAHSVVEFGEPDEDEGEERSTVPLGG